MAPSSWATPPNESIQWLQFSDMWYLGKTQLAGDGEPMPLLQMGQGRRS